MSTSQCFENKFSRRYINVVHVKPGYRQEGTNNSHKKVPLMEPKHVCVPEFFTTNLHVKIYNYYVLRRSQISRSTLTAETFNLNGAGKI